MTGNQLISAYTEIVKDDFYPVLGITSSGVDSTFALIYLNIASRRVMRSLRRQVKTTFNFTPAQTAYNLLTTTSKPIFEVYKVTVSGAEVPRVAIDDTTTNGYYIIGDTLTFMKDYGSAVAVVIYGYNYAADIAANDNAITDIPVDLHLPLVQLAVVESCGSHENGQDQLLRLQAMEVKAEDAISRQARRDGANTFPSSLTNGTK